MALKSIIASALLLAGVASAAQCSNTLNTSYPAPVPARGWSYRLVATGLRKPRGLLFDKLGGLLVIDSGAGVVHYSLKDDGKTCVSVDKKTLLVNQTDLNHGIALDDEGQTLYASSADKVFKWTYDAKEAKLTSDASTIIINMSNSDHTTRTLLLSKKQPGTLLVSRGSDSNQDFNATDKNTGHAQLRSFDLSKISGGNDTAPYVYLDGKLVGWGLRNSVGVAEHVDGGLWSVENSVDQLQRDGEDIHQDNPGEELNYHGTLDKPDDAPMGSNFGYPVCFAVWNTTNFPNLGNLTTAAQFPGDQSSEAARQNVSDWTCNDKYIAPRLAFQAHMAPLDIKFDSGGERAFISFHGSWNRENPIGYKISALEFKDGQPTAEHSSTDALIDILTTPDLSKCPDDCFRPVGLAWDKTGRLWVTSDATGEIFVLNHDDSSSGEGKDNGKDNGKGDKKNSGSHMAPGLAAMTLVSTIVAALLA